MTNTRRNTIVLSSLLLLIVIGTLVQMRSINKKKNEVSKKNNLLMGQIAVLENQISNIDSLKREYILQQEMVAQQSKLIISLDTPTVTYQYLLKLMAWMKRDIIFNFALSSSAVEGRDWNEYILSGRTHFANLVALVNNIEHQRTLVTIEELSIGNDGIADSDTVSFSMICRTHFKPGGAEPSSVTPKAFPHVPASYMLFKTRIYEQPRIVEVDPRLLRLDALNLIGISEDRAFLRDAQGIIRILTVGDKIAYGYLSAINIAEEKAIFKIDLYGIPEEKTLFLKRN